MLQLVQALKYEGLDGQQSRDSTSLKNDLPTYLESDQTLSQRERYSFFCVFFLIDRLFCLALVFFKKNICRSVVCSTSYQRSDSVVENLNDPILASASGSSEPDVYSDIGNKEVH